MWLHHGGAQFQDIVVCEPCILDGIVEICPEKQCRHFFGLVAYVVAVFDDGIGHHVEMVAVRQCVVIVLVDQMVRPVCPFADSVYQR